jgi:hypothetical protein
MRIHVIYRSARSGGKQRPAYFDHEVALLSFLRAIAPCGDAVRVTFLNDGEIQPERLALMQGRGELVDAGGVGNCGSHRAALALAEGIHARDDDVIYFAEDDYIYLPNAFSELLVVGTELPDTDYFCLQYAPTIRQPADRRAAEAGQRWVGIRSATMTFGVRAARLAQDSWVHWLGTRHTYPHDQAIWPATLGGSRYRLVHALTYAPIVSHDGLLLQHVLKSLLVGRRRRDHMIAPWPTLATHGELADTAEGVDWAGVVDDVRAWATATSTPAGG